ncbi:MAG TPA: hypothetical protein VLV81_00005 [Acidimicrobiia bacterium]|nr:hypothetical protein [Acidimicrobiia bacterium]
MLALERLFRRRPDLARVAGCLATAVAWIGAGEALEPPRTLRHALFDQERFRCVDLDAPPAAEAIRSAP